MTTGNPEGNMTFGELLALIGSQQRRLTVLENAFAFLSFCLDEKANQLLIHSLRLESQIIIAMKRSNNISPTRQNNWKNAATSASLQVIFAVVIRLIKLTSKFY
ncbi:hypothetical protein SAMN05216516_101290 [Izhakiella capsodis]|uniref:Uncharacterized protein n=1 Tax=Izhakiella capsodis TaxID=1367852 RepID=A0A1I4URG5_9GAMM|nr:hypothetical protein SAMN05216516_101290 [Izhakiella capsodis]